MKTTFPQNMLKTDTNLCLAVMDHSCNKLFFKIILFVDCGEFDYGPKCELRCPCNTNTSASCDAQSGRCTCEAGYTGRTCECLDPSVQCHPQFSHCVNNTCVCDEGPFTSSINCSGIISNTILFKLFHCLKAVLKYKDLESVYLIGEYNLIFTRLLANTCVFNNVAKYDKADLFFTFY